MPSQCSHNKIERLWGLRSRDEPSQVRAGQGLRSPTEVPFPSSTLYANTTEPLALPGPPSTTGALLASLPQAATHRPSWSVGAKGSGPQHQIKHHMHYQNRPKSESWRGRCQGLLSFGASVSPPTTSPYSSRPPSWGTAGSPGADLAPALQTSASSWCRTLELRAQAPGEWCPRPWRQLRPGSGLVSVSEVLRRGNRNAKPTFEPPRAPPPALQV